MSSTASSPDQYPQSAFGILRLLFASLVIVSHATELVDGNRVREPLTRAGGAISLGDIAVDGFFLVSGFLIVGSYLSGPGIAAYLRKRIARIYPGFLVASGICLFIVAPLAGGSFDWIGHNLNFAFLRAMLLQEPAVPDVFPGQSHPDINGAMWTIAYEFRCYLLIVVLNSLGLFRRPWTVAILAAGSLTTFELFPAGISTQLDHSHALWLLWFGAPVQVLRFTGIFLVGAFAFLIRHRVRYSLSGVTAAAVLLAASIFVPTLAEPAVATFGAYIVFAAARWARTNRLRTVNNRTDISYGVYLYAWPIAQLLIRYCPSWSPVAQGLVTLATASVCGWLSWKYVERPVMAFASKLSAEGLQNKCADGAAAAFRAAPKSTGEVTN